MKVTLPNGLVVEVQADEVGSLPKMLEALGFGRERPQASDGQRPSSVPGSGSAARVASSGVWTRDKVDALVGQLTETSRRLIEVLLEGPPEGLSTAVIAEHLEMQDRRGLGPVLAAIGKRAKALRLPNPVRSVNAEDGERQIRVDQRFAAVAKEVVAG